MIMSQVIFDLRDGILEVEELFFNENSQHFLRVCMNPVVLFYGRDILKTLHISKFISFKSHFPIRMPLKCWEQVL